MDLTSKLTAAFKCTCIKDNDFQDAVQSLQIVMTETLADGVASGQADLVFADRRALVADEVDMLDLAGGSLSDIFGDALTFVKVKAILFHNRSDDLGTPTASIISIHPDVTAGFIGPFNSANDKISLPAGAWIAIVDPGAGWTVGAGASDELTFEEEATLAGSFDVCIIGASA